MFELALPEWGPHLLLIFLHYKCPPTQKSLQNKEAYYWSVLQMIKVHQIWAQCEICKGKFFANRSPSGSILHCGKSNWNFGHIFFWFTKLFDLQISLYSTSQNLDTPTFNYLLYYYYNFFTFWYNYNIKCLDFFKQGQYVFFSLHDILFLTFNY